MECDERTNDQRADGWKALRMSYRKFGRPAYGRLRVLDSKLLNKNGPNLGKDRGKTFPTPEQSETAIRMNGEEPLAA